MGHFSRRRTLLGAACLLGCGHVHAAPTCTDVTAPPELALSPAEQERHTIFLLLAMALVFDGWGVDRLRPELLDAYAAAEPGRQFPDYAGHNIGAVLVDATATVICAALNRSVVLNSTLEHAEARTVADAFKIANRKGAARWSFGSLLQGTQLYTTLEPCAQCAGIVELASIGQVIYGQDDPTQHKIVNVLHNLREPPDAPAGPLPIRATFTPYWSALSAAYETFLAAPPIGARSGLTSFLQTVPAYLIYRQAAETFKRMQAQAITNEPALHAARAFRARWQQTIRNDGVAPDLPPGEPGVLAR